MQHWCVINLNKFARYLTVMASSNFLFPSLNANLVRGIFAYLEMPGII